MILSNKAILPVLWELFPDQPESAAVGSTEAQSIHLQSAGTQNWRARGPTSPW